MTEVELLSKRILSHSEYFNQMLELIPPFAYFAQSGTPNNNTYIFKKSGVQSYKIKTKDKQIAKFDPENYRSVPKILKEQSKKDDDDDETEDPTKLQNESTTNSEITAGFVETDIVTVREELKKRLREKLNAMRTKRKAPSLSDDPENKAIEPPAKRRKIEERRKEKSKKKEDSMKKRKGSKGNKTPPKTPPKTQTQPQKNVDDSTIEFATFDFSSGAPVPTYLQNKKRTSKTQLLKQVQEKKKKLNEQQGTEEGEKLAKQDAWATMKKRAQGEKVKNDVEKLKKSIKRDMSLKKKEQKGLGSTHISPKEITNCSTKEESREYCSFKGTKTGQKTWNKKKEISLKISTAWFRR